MDVSENSGVSPQIIHVFIGDFHCKPSILGVFPLIFGSTPKWCKLSPGLSYRLGASAAGEFIFCLVRLPEATAQAMLGFGVFSVVFFFSKKGCNIP